MTELVASLVLRLVDQWSSGARAAQRGLGDLERAAGGFGQAGSVAARNAQRLAGAAGQVAGVNRSATAATAALTTATAAASGAAQRLTGARTAEAVATASGGRAAAAAAAAHGLATRAAIESAGAAERGASASGRGAEAAQRAAEAQSGLASATARAGEAAETSYRRFSQLERMQSRGAAAGRALRTEYGRLQGRLGTLAMGTIVTDGMARTGETILRPMESAVQRAADYQYKLLGMAAMADLSPKQMREVSLNTFNTAQKIGLPLNLALEHDRSVVNENVYHDSPASLNTATRAASRLSMLAEATNSPITPDQSAELIQTYAHSLNAPVQTLEHLNAIITRASQLGGDKVGDVARFMPQIMAQMKGSAFGNENGFKDATAALQIVKRVAGSDEAAGIDLTDLLFSLRHRLTKKRFLKQGVDLDKLFIQAHQRGVSPMDAVIGALRARIGDNPDDPLLGSKLGEIFPNQQAAQAAQALLQFGTRDQPGSMSYRTLRRGLDAQNLDRAYDSRLNLLSTSQRAGLTRAENAKERASITTGDTLNPLTRLVNAFTTGSAGALNDVQGGVAGRSLVRAFALAGASAGGIGKVSHLAVDIATPIIIGRSLLRMGGLGARQATGRAAGLAARVLSPGAGAARAAGAAARPVAARAAQAAAQASARPVATRVAQAAVRAAARPAAARAAQAVAQVAARPVAARAAQAAAQASARPVATRVAQAAVRAAARPAAARAAQAAAQGAARPVAARAAQAAAGAATGRAAGAGAAEAAAAAAGRFALLGRIGGALARAPLGELLFLPGLVRDVRRNNATYGAGALAWLTHDRAMAARASARLAGLNAPFRADAAPARPAGFSASAEPPPRAPVQDLAAFGRAVSADAAAMLAHARALGALATAEIAAAGRIATAAGAPAPAAALASTGPRQGAPAAVRQVNNHFHIHGSSDPHATGRAAARAARAEEHRALHDGADG